jgi:DNA-directed RNA polymerase specialized sigma24 family protein
MSPPAPPPAPADPPTRLFAEPEGAAALFDVLLDPGRDWPARWAAAEAVVAHYTPRIRRWAARKTRDPDDVTAEVVVKIVRTLEARAWDRGRGFGGLVGTMTATATADYYRRGGEPAAGGEDESPAHPAPQDPPTATGSQFVAAHTLGGSLPVTVWRFHQADLESGLAAVMALRRLDPAGRRAVFETVINDVPDETAAEREGKSLPALRTLRSRFKDYVAEELAVIQELVPAVRRAWFEPPCGPARREDGDVSDAILAALGRQDGTGHALLRRVVLGVAPPRGSDAAKLSADDVRERVDGFKADVEDQLRRRTAAGLAAHAGRDDGPGADELKARLRAALGALSLAEVEAVRLGLVARRSPDAAAARTGLDEFDVLQLLGRFKRQTGM